MSEVEEICTSVLSFWEMVDFMVRVGGACRILRIYLDNEVYGFWHDVHKTQRNWIYPVSINDHVLQLLIQSCQLPLDQVGTLIQASAFAICFKANHIPIACTISLTTAPRHITAICSH